MGVRENIFALRGRAQRKAVEAPGFAGAYIRKLSARERDAYETGMVQGVGRKAKANLDNVRARLVALCLTGEDGKRLFGDDDIEALGELPGDALDLVYDECMAFNAMDEAGKEAIRKNLPATTAGDSPTGSSSTSAGIRPLT